MSCILPKPATIREVFFSMAKKLNLSALEHIYKQDDISTTVRIRSDDKKKLSKKSDRRRDLNPHHHGFRSQVA